MNKLYFIFLFAFTLILNSAFGQIPEGYYTTIEGKNGDELKQALNAIIKNHTGLSYGDARYILDEADKDESNPNKIRVIYSSHTVSNTWDSGKTWNREHVWSKSRGFPELDNYTIGPGSDLHNLRACIPEINSDKGNRWFGTGISAHSYENVSTGNYLNDTDWIWEPRDEDKGDVARILFYMAVRYQGENGEPDLEVIDYLPEDKYTNDAVYARLSELLAWHIADPVDDFERRRNNVIYSYQNNRNPFIDKPELASNVFDMVVSEVNTEPGSPTKNEMVNVSAHVSAMQGVQEVSLKWGNSVANLNQSIVMELSGDKKYTSISSIPGTSSGTIYYQVSAKNPSGISYKSIVHSYAVITGVVSKNVDQQKGVNPLKIRPNPARNIIYVPGQYANAKFAIYNIIGEQVLHGVVFQNQIFIDDIPNGTYFLRVSDNGKHLSNRFIKAN